MRKKTNKYPPSLRSSSKIFCLLLLFFGSLSAFAQQEWSYSQYLFNLYDINSAYAGNHNASSFGLRYRTQWMGMEGAPVTQQLSWHAPFADGKVGLGARLQNEMIGLREQQQMMASAAYKIGLHQHTLSFALAAGALRYNLLSEETSARNVDDIALTTAGPSIVPVVNFSIFLNSDHFYAGVESARINRNNLTKGEALASRLYYNMSLTGGYMKKIGYENLLQFSVLMKYSEGSIWQAEGNVLFLAKNKYWFGGGYRYQHGAIVMACINITPQWRFGLSYDLPFAFPQIQKSGSAEAFLGFNLKAGSDKSIRYF